MGSLDVDSLFTNITLEETIGIKEDWNCHWHKEVDPVDMGLPLGKYFGQYIFRVWWKTMAKRLTYRI